MKKVLQLTIKKMVTVVLFLMLHHTMVAQQQPDSTTISDRKFFNFLEGSWKIVSLTLESKTT